MGCCSATALTYVLRVAQSTIESIFGPDAVAVDKTCHGRQLPFIGWDIDLDSCRVSIAEHNFKKLLYGLFSLDLAAPIPLRTLQRLVSWFSRYSQVVPQLKPFSSDLSKNLWGRAHSPHRLRALDVAGRECIELWRMYATLLRLRGATYALDIRSFNTLGISHTIEFDASLQGSAFIITSVSPGFPPRLVAQIVYPFSLRDDSSFQNASEFLTVVLALGFLARSGVTDAGIALVGDNTTSLAWAAKEKFKNHLSRRAAMMFIAICTMCNFRVEDTQHIAGIDNVTCDLLSRKIEKDSTPHSLGFTEEQIIDWDSDSRLTSLLVQCDPTADTSDLAVLSAEITSCLHTLLHT
jgi:hypothetical protein